MTASHEYRGFLVLCYFKREVLLLSYFFHFSFHIKHSQIFWLLVSCLCGLQGFVIIDLLSKFWDVRKQERPRYTVTHFTTTVSYSVYVLATSYWPHVTVCYCVLLCIYIANGSWPRSIISVAPTGGGPPNPILLQAPQRLGPALMVVNDCIDRRYDLLSTIYITLHENKMETTTEIEIVSFTVQTASLSPRGDFPFSAGWLFQIQAIDTVQGGKCADVFMWMNTSDGHHIWRPCCGALSQERYWLHRDVNGHCSISVFTTTRGALEDTHI